MLTTWIPGGRKGIRPVHIYQKSQNLISLPVCIPKCTPSCSRPNSWNVIYDRFDSRLNSNRYSGFDSYSIRTQTADSQISSIGLYLAPTQMDVIPTNLNRTQPKTHMRTRVCSNNINECYCVCVCVCVDYEATLTAILEALTLLTQHINVLYTLLQSLMDQWRSRWSIVGLLYQ